MVPLSQLTFKLRTTKEARSRDTGVAHNNNANSDLHVASVARRGGYKRLSVLPLPPPYLLRHYPRLTSLLGVTQSPHATFNFPPERLLGGAQGGHPARSHASEHEPRVRLPC